MLLQYVDDIYNLGFLAIITLRTPKSMSIEICLLLNTEKSFQIYYKGIIYIFKAINEFHTTYSTTIYYFYITPFKIGIYLNVVSSWTLRVVINLTIIYSSTS